MGRRLTLSPNPLHQEVVSLEHHGGMPRARTGAWSGWVEHAFFFLFQLQLHFFMEKALVTHSSTLAWKIPWTEEPGGLQSTGSLRVGHD